MNIRSLSFASSWLIGLACLAPACGGVVELGAKAGEQTETPPAETPPSTNPSQEEAPGADAPEELLYDGKTSIGGAAYITDFAGEGGHVYAAVNLVANLQAGRVLDLPAQREGATALYNASPQLVGDLGLIGDGQLAVFAEGGATDGKPDAIVVRTRADGSGGGMLVTRRFATHPKYPELLYVEDGVRRWSATGGSSTAIPVTGGGEVLAFAIGGGATAVALVKDGELTPTLNLVREARGGGGGSPTDARQLTTLPTASVVSNMVVDDTHAYFAWQQAGETYLLRLSTDAGPSYPFDLASAKLATLPANSSVRIAVDSTDVYVATAPTSGTTCPGLSGDPPCLYQVSLVRFSKTTPGTATPLKTWTGPNGVSRYRAFNLADEYVVWSEGERLFRQGKRSIKP